MLVNPISVSELTAQIKSVLSSPGFRNIAVKGELSNFVHHSSGHMYFSLKDKQSRIKAVMFRGRNQKLDFRPQNGDTLIAVGSLGVYEPSGEYQLYVESLLAQGIGDLHLAFQRLKEQLEGEGLFSIERKLQLPFLPKRIGVITSPTGAAVRDILHVLRRRFTGVQVLLIPALVQGVGAPASLLSALLQAQRSDIDVVIIGRGGGSFEELAAFNDEDLARAIANCPIPVISAVGHETDFTIADFVADLRAPTPSAAAELVVPQKGDLLAGISELQNRLTSAVLRQINSERRYLRGFSESSALQRPEQLVARWRQKVDELWTSMGQSQAHTRRLKQAQLCSLAGKLEALSPLGTLSRGYSICQDEAGKVIRSSGEVEVGSALRVRLHEGKLLCRVEGREYSHE